MIQQFAHTEKGIFCLRLVHLSPSCFNTKKYEILNSRKSVQDYPHQRNLTPIDVKLSSELLVTADDRIHLLTAAQLVMGAFHFPQARREGNISTNHHVYSRERRGEKRREELVIVKAFLLH